MMIAFIIMFIIVSFFSLIIPPLPNYIMSANFTIVIFIVKKAVIAIIK